MRDNLGRKSNPSRLLSGIIFEEYDTPEVKTVNSVATIGQSKGAWFKDSEGILLALGQFD
jgi:hypothetical protein